jgi:cytochrome c oxidase subunit 2
MSRVVRLAPLLLLALLGGCEGVQTAFGGQGEHGQQFITLFVIFAAVCTFMYLLVVGAMIAALLRRRRDGKAHVVEERTHHGSDARLRPLLIGWVALIGIGLAALTVSSYLFDRADAQTAARDTLWIDVTANQWWWDVTYVSRTASGNLRTANELHLPVGVPARIRLRSNDVIHSFWVPNLAGKQDLIRLRRILRRAARAYGARRQCRERRRLQALVCRRPAARAAAAHTACAGRL